MNEQIKQKILLSKYVVDKHLLLKFLGRSYIIIKLNLKY